MRRATKPWYQIVAEVIGIAFAAFVGLGAVLDAVGNAELITPTLTYAGTLAIVLGGLVLHVVSRRRRLRILLHGGIHGHFSGLRRYHVAAGTGIIVLLWIPRLFSSTELPSASQSGAGPVAPDTVASAPGLHIGVLPLDSAILSRLLDPVRVNRTSVVFPGGEPIPAIILLKEEFPLQVAMAWKFTLTNTGSRALSIVDYQVLNAVFIALPQDGEKFVTETVGDLASTVFTARGDSEGFPLNLAPGESKALEVRAQLPLDSMAHEALRGKIPLDVPVTKFRVFNALRETHYQFPFDAVPSMGFYGTQAIPSSRVPPGASVARWVRRGQYWTVGDAPEGSRPYIQFVFRRGDGRITRLQVPVYSAAEAVKKWYRGNAAEDAGSF